MEQRRDVGIRMVDVGYRYWIWDIDKKIANIKLPYLVRYGNWSIGSGIYDIRCRM